MIEIYVFLTVLLFWSEDENQFHGLGHPAPGFLDLARPMKKDLPRPSMVWKTKTKIGNHHLGESHMNCEPAFTCLQCLQIYRSKCHHIGFLFSLQDLFADSIRVCRGKMDNTVLGSQLAGLRVNKDSADVSLICEEQVVKAHSQILGMR